MLVSRCIGVVNCNRRGRRRVLYLQRSVRKEPTSMEAAVKSEVFEEEVMLCL